MIDITNNADDLRAYLAAELHCAATEHKLAAADLEAVRLALVGGLISPAQAIGHVEATDRFRFSIGSPENADLSGPRARANTTNSAGKTRTCAKAMNHDRKCRAEVLIEAAGRAGLTVHETIDSRFSQAGKS